MERKRRECQKMGGGQGERNGRERKTEAEKGEERGEQRRKWMLRKSRWGEGRRGEDRLRKKGNEGGEIQRREKRGRDGRRGGEQEVKV